MSERVPFNPAGIADRFLSALLDAADDAIIGKDLDGRVVTWNRAAVRLYGYEAAAVVGQSIALIVPEWKAAELQQILARVGSGERVGPIETVRRTADGRLVDVSITVSPIRDDKGLVVGAATIARDLTALKRDTLALHDSQARWRAIVESAVDAIIVIDARGTVEAFNPAAERLFGYAEAEVTGQNVNLLMPSPDRERHDGYLSRYLSTGDAHIIGIGREVTARRRDGTVLPVHLSVAEMAIDGEPKFVGTIHDLTSRVKLEERLREQAAMARLGEMAAVVAHEIKNPLAGIRGAVQVIGGRLPAESREAAVALEIVARIDSLNVLVKDLLVFARPPQPHVTAVNPHELVAATVEFLQRDPIVRGMTITIDGAPHPIAADPELIRIVLVNIIVNAAQATGGTGRLRIALEEAGDGVRLAFHDNGPGIPEDVRAKVFTPFFTTKSRGTGLGLSTARKLIEAQGGTMTLECPPEDGTVVIVRLPALHTLPPHAS